MSAQPPLSDLPAGIWQHYKGPSYLVLGYGHDANVDDRNVVVYIGLYLDPTKPGPRLSVRTVEDFFAIVCPVSGIRFEHCTDSHHQQTDSPLPTRRFSYLGPALTAATPTSA